MKEATPLGNYIRKLRLNHSDSLRAMGKKMGLSGAYLSALETGKVAPSRKWLKKIEIIYDLDESEMEELLKAYADTVGRHYVNYRTMREKVKGCCILFLDSIDKLSDEDALKVEGFIRGILEAKKN